MKTIGKGLFPRAVYIDLVLVLTVRHSFDIRKAYQAILDPSGRSLSGIVTPHTSTTKSSTSASLGPFPMVFLSVMKSEQGLCTMVYDCRCGQTTLISFASRLLLEGASMPSIGDSSKK